MAPESMGLPSLLNALAENAAFACGADDALIALGGGEAFEQRAHFGPHPAVLINGHAPLVREGSLGRLFAGQTVHVADMWEATDLPAFLMDAARRDGWHTALIVPFEGLGGVPGFVMVRRTRVEPYSNEEIARLESIARLSAMAVEHEWLQEEVALQKRQVVAHAEELQEALEHQSATAEVLGIISRSPSDVQPVLEAICESAARVCGVDDVALRIYEAGIGIVRAHFGEIPIARPELPMDESGELRWMREQRDHGTLHVPDTRAGGDRQVLRSSAPFRAYLGVMLKQHDEPIGILYARRVDPIAFSDAQIKLFETFADQAVIALENARLFHELQEKSREQAETLEEQAATNHILEIISQFPTDVQPVLDAIVESAAGVCGVDDLVLRLNEGGVARARAHFGPLHETPVEVSTDGDGARWMAAHGTLHIPDLLARRDDFPDLGRTSGARTWLLVPLRYLGEVLGTLMARRMEAQPFTDRQIKLIETYAEQAVIAIENVRLFNEINERNAQLREALEQQTATAEVLEIIASSPTDVQPVLDAICISAARVCQAVDVNLWSRDGDELHLSAHVGPFPVMNEHVPIGLDGMLRRVVAHRRTNQTADILAESGMEGMKAAAERAGWRSVLQAPLLREGEVVGVLGLRRAEPVAFTEKQVQLLESFAAQAVIAIENVRLFRELQEALEQQTATAEVLRVIASSPTDIQPVLDAIVASAARLCQTDDAVIGLVEGNDYTATTGAGPMPISPFPATLDTGSTMGRAALERRTIYLADALAQSEWPVTVEAAQHFGFRSIVAVPLLREDAVVGTLHLRHPAVDAFSERQIALLETFAAQAVIAIENMRLFKELNERNAQLREALDRQTATAEVLNIISRSPTEVQPVLDAIASSVSRLLEGADVVIRQVEGDTLRRVAHVGELSVNPDLTVSLRADAPATLTMRAVTERRTIQVRDIRSAEGAAYPGVPQRSKATGELVGADIHTVLATPLLREGQPVGTLMLRRTIAQPFTDPEIALIETFAFQAVIAIENARLYAQIQEQNQALELASQHKSEFLANMSHELRTPLNAIIGFSDVLADRMLGELNDQQAEFLGDIQESGRHLLSLINDILDLSKIEAGQLELDVEPFSLPEALESSLTMVRERASNHGIALSLEIAAGVDTVEADERKVKQILFNLLSNAVKFTPDGGRIELIAQPRHGAIQIAVQDTGVGIAPEDQERIFEEFQQARSGPLRAKVEGTGLGLSLAKRFVELHGGRLWLESQPGTGSTFTFTLPMEPPRRGGIGAGETVLGSTEAGPPTS
jgi:signal transduction histidine kinase/putative methionine-R-sulfoxide reductase with GAF domain